MRVFYYGCDLLYTIAQVWLVLQAVGSMFEPKRQGKWFLVGQTVAAGAVVLNKLLDTVRYQVLFSNGKMIEIAFLIALALYFFYQCRLRDAFCISTLLLTGLALADFFVETCVYLALEEVGLQKDILLSLNYYRGTYLLIWAGVMFLGGKKLKGWLARNKTEVLRYRRQGYVLLLPLLVCMVYFQRIYLGVASGQMLGHWFLFLLCNMVMESAFMLGIVKNRAERENQMRQMKLELLAENYHTLQVVHQERAILVHDMRNHFRALWELLALEHVDEAKEYISEMTDILKEGEQIVYTNHEMLDLILNRKIQEARRAQIEVSCQCDDMEGLALNLVEISALFANLWDNAIEAAEKCSDGTERRIEMSCRREKDLLVVTMSNSMEAEPVWQGKETLALATTKDDKLFHGLGIPSIQNVLDHYGGYMDVDTEGRVFYARLYLSAFSGERT